MKNQLLYLTALLCIITAHNSSAQAICGFDFQHEKNMRENAAYRSTVLANEASIQRIIKANASSRVSAGITYKIPVVVHVIHTGGAVGSIYNPTDAQITGAINYLNQVYDGTYPGTEGVGDIQIQFVLASRDPNCNATTGIDRINGSGIANYTANGVNNANTSGATELAVKNLARWDASAYYNIYVVNKIDGKDGTSGQFVAGFAYYAEATDHMLDGTIMLATQMTSGQKTLPHEIGHALDLLHPFNGSADVNQCPANADCTTDGDRVCDTDPISNNNLGGLYDFSCRTGSNACNGGAPYSINTEHNYMSYTTCYTLFTAGQKARMQAAMMLPNRASLVSSWAIPGASYPMSPFVAPGAASCSPATGAPGLSGNYAGIMGLTVGNISISSDNARDDGGYLNKASQCEFLISLNRNNSYTFTATVMGFNYEQLRAWIDYNNNGVFDNVTEQVYVNTVIPPATASAPATVSGSFTVPASAVTGTAIRLRVTNELSTVHGLPAISSGCYAPTYGQVEDYPVLISVAAALPVTLEYLTGIRKDQDVLLSWKTAAEQNAQEFQVEKSTDGISFTTIGTVNALNSAAGFNYSFNDKNAGLGRIYYRLKQVDKDTRSDYSKIISVEGQSVRGGMRIINNPFTDKLDVDFGKPQSGQVTVRLLDIAGKEVYQVSSNISGQSKLRINVAGKNISAGLYLLQVINGHDQLIEKVIKQ